MKNLIKIALIVTFITTTLHSAHATTLPRLLLKGVKVNGLSNAKLKNYNTGGPIAGKLITDNVNHLYIYVIGPGSNQTCMNAISSVYSRLANSSSASIDIGTPRTAIFLGVNPSNGYRVFRMYADKCTEK